MSGNKVIIIRMSGVSRIIYCIGLWPCDPHAGKIKRTFKDVNLVAGWLTRTPLTWCRSLPWPPEREGRLQSRDRLGRGRLIAEMKAGKINRP